MEPRDKGDFRQCAAREVFEETVGIDSLIILKSKLMTRIESAPEQRIHVPFLYDYKVFCVRLNFIPDLRVWPNRFHWGNEFERFGWFRCDRLPLPLHPGIVSAVRAFRPALSCVERDP